MSSTTALKLTRTTLFTYVADHELCQDMARHLFKKVAAGDVRITIGQRYPLEEVAQAHRDLEGRKTTGSTILTL